MKWTVYSEEKPQMVGSYLVTHTTDSGRYYVDYDYWTVLDKFKYHPTDVVAWMPFPKPYSKDEPQTDCNKLINEVVKLDMSREDKFKVMELLERHCEKCKHYLFTDIDGHYCEHETYGQPCSYETKDGPTISKMEQVDKDDAYFLELMGAVERGEISDAAANQAWYEYINHKDEPQTDCAWR